VNDFILYARRPGHRQVHRLQTIFKKGRTSIYVCKEVEGKGEPIGTLVALCYEDAVYFGFCRLNRKDRIQKESVTIEIPKGPVLTKVVTRYVHASKKEGVRIATVRANRANALLGKSRKDGIRMRIVGGYINLDEGYGVIETSRYFLLRDLMAGLENGNGQFLEQAYKIFSQRDGVLRVSEGDRDGQ
jgi:hypothetical protein